jgi:hypothetical protein
MVNVETPNGCVANDKAMVYVSTINTSPKICMVNVDENDRNVIVVKKKNQVLQSSLILSIGNHHYRRINMI